MLDSARAMDIVDNSLTRPFKPGYFFFRKKEMNYYEELSFRCGTFNVK